MTYPKLFIAAEHGEWAKAIKTEYTNAAEPKELVIYSDRVAHGTDLFSSSEYRDQFLKALLDFVNSLA